MKSAPDGIILDQRLDNTIIESLSPLGRDLLRVATSRGYMQEEDLDKLGAMPNLPAGEFELLLGALETLDLPVRRKPGKKTPQKTERHDTEALRQYLDEIGKIDRLTPLALPRRLSWLPWKR